MSSYEVGQILYLTNEKSFKIIPVQVVEEVVRTTIDGKHKTYLVQFPDKDRSVVDINNLKYKCFRTENEVRDYLIQNTKEAIERLLKMANELRNECFSYKKTPVEEEVQITPDEKNIITPNLVQPDIQSDIIKIDLGGGLTGRFKTSDLNTGEE
jgi:hypothetical protein